MWAHFASRMLRFSVLLVALVVSVPGASGDEFSDLVARWNEQYEAGEHRSAQQTASRLVRLANQGSGGKSGRPDALYFLAQSLLDQGEYETALPLSEKSIRLYLEIYPEQHSDLGYGYHQLGRIQDALGRRDEAVKTLGKAVAIRIAVDGEDSENTGHSSFQFGRVLLEMGAESGNDEQLEQAETAMRAAVSVFLKAEGTLGAETARSRVNLARIIGHRGRYDEAVQEFTRAANIYIQNEGEQSSYVGDVLWYGGNMFVDAERFDEAIGVYQNAISIYQAAYGENHTEVAETVGRLADAYRQKGETAEALDAYRRSIAIYRQHVDDDDDLILNLRWDMGRTHLDAEDGAAAITIFEELGPLYEEWQGKDSLDATLARLNLAIGYRLVGRLDEAEKLLERCRAAFESSTDEEAFVNLCSSITELANVRDISADYEGALRLHRDVLGRIRKEYGHDHIETGWAIQNLGLLHQRWSRDEEALAQHKQALAIFEKEYDGNHLEVALGLNNVAGVYHDQGRYTEAKPLYDRALAMYQALGTDESSDAALTLRNLAIIYNDQGNIAKAMELAKQAHRIYKQEYGDTYYEVANSLTTLADVHMSSSDYDEARALYQRALDIHRTHYASERDQIAACMYGLATVMVAKEEYAAAEEQYKKVFEIYRAIYGENHSDTAVIYHDLAELMIETERYEEAQAYLDKCAPVYQQALPQRHPLFGWLWHDQAALYHKLGQDEEAEPLIDQAILLRERLGVSPTLRYASYLVRAEVHWAKGRQSEAINDLEDAIRCAEEQRGAGYGAGREKANLFSAFTEAYERMVEWQLERRNMSDAFEAIEKMKTQSLRDQFYYVQFANLNDTGDGDDRERQLRQELSELDREIKTVAADSGRQSEAYQKLQQTRKQKVQELYEWKRDRMQLRVDRAEGVLGQERTRQLRQIQRDVLDEHDLMLLYLLGEHGSYVMVVDAESAHLEAIEVDADAAKTLGIESGPLTAEMMDQVINYQLQEGDKREKQGIMPQITRSESAQGAIGKLAAMWRVLIPEAQRKRLVSDEIEKLFVVPDGSLALLPLETLVVRSGRDPQYLLDVGPPIVYGPSATMVHNAMYSNASERDGKHRVVSVGDPAYGAIPSVDDTSETHTGTRYASAGGELARLPYSAVESGWVNDMFSQNDIDVKPLLQADATEANVRQSIHGASVVHLACHGLTDQEYSNLFGALALTPGPEATIEPADDGFLSLDEIYQLDLDGCEVSILSACETNYGPQQKGEGVWSLSRGFLVAGSQRVVASNWLVDDEAAASLISVYCGRIAKEMAAGNESINHAAALLAAKRWVRKHSKWKSPYYWATFVLVGRD